MSRHSTSWRTSRRNVLKLAGLSVTTVGASGLAAGSGVDHVEVNVGFHNDAGKAAAREAAGQVKREFDSLDAMTLELPEPAVENLRNNADVRYVEENPEAWAEGHYDDFYPWGVERVDADVVHDQDVAGTGASVAILDTGIDPDHPDISPNVSTGACFVDCGGSPSWNDVHGHGTHVAGTVAAAQRDAGVIGVAHEANLHAAKVLGDTGGGSASTIAGGIEWAADQGHDVINMSLGTGYSSLIDDACTYAWNRDVVLVCSAGNEGSYNSMTYPSTHDDVIAVSATNEWDNLASFSSYGPDVDFAAPGVDVWSASAGGGFEEMSGTSMAAPHVAGVASMLKAGGNDNSSTWNAMSNAAEDIGLASYEQGDGLVNAGNLL